MGLLSLLALLLNNVLGAYSVLVIAHVVLSWVSHLNVTTVGNKIVSALHQITTSLVEPVLGWLRSRVRFLVVGVVDLSPLVLILLVNVLQVLLLSVVL